MFSVDKQGVLTAKKGRIGGWQITDTAIFFNKQLGPQADDNNSIVLDAKNGQLRGGTSNTNNWYIRADGTAGFRNITKLNGTIGDDNSLVGKNFTFGGSYSAINPNIPTLTADVNLNIGTLGAAYKNKFDTLYANKITVNELSAKVVKIEKAQITEAKIQTLFTNYLWMPINGIGTSIIGKFGHIDEDILALQKAVAAIQIPPKS